ncbi:cytochrome P450 [Nocardia sp. NPDC051911]|uniref:cytochrome P450 n=1 Tax=Nocardia sp. NPDC051911 TaxID=3154648 RepID=UPI00344330CD
MQLAGVGIGLWRQTEAVMRNQWKDLQRIERKCRKRPVFRTWSGHVVVGAPELAREAVLVGTGQRLSGKPLFWKADGDTLPRPSRVAMNQWVTGRVARQDPAESARAAVRRLLVEAGDLHYLCAQGVLDGLLNTIGCADDERLEQIVRRFFATVFVPLILGQLDPQTNVRRFEQAASEAGTLLAGRDLIPPVLGELGEREPALLGELYLRTTSAFVASLAISFAWLIAALSTERLVSLGAMASRAELRRARPEWIALETLRLWPPIWELRRTALCSQRIGELSVLKGDFVHVPVYAIHRQPDRWENPDAFDPARWHDRAPSSLLTFSAGPSACVGARFATEWLAAAGSAVLDEPKGLRTTCLERVPNVATSLTPPLHRVDPSE